MYSGGRVNISEPNVNDFFTIKEKVPIQSYNQPLKGIWNETQLSKLFFSAKNIQTLQNGIRKGVYDLSNKQYVIDQQNTDELKIIMRGIFLEYARNLPNNITQQIQELNSFVLDYTIKQVYNSTKAHYKYLNDINNMYQPIPPPILSTTKCDSYELPKWF